MTVKGLDNLYALLMMLTLPWIALLLYGWAQIMHI